MIRPWASFIEQIAMTLWVGGHLVVGYLVVPVLFSALDDRMQAGVLAGAVFAWMNKLGLLCAAILLVRQMFKFEMRRRLVLSLILASLALTLVAMFGLQPEMSRLKALVAPLDVMHSPMRDRFGLVHGLASSLYLVQSLLGLGLLRVIRAG